MHNDVLRFFSYFSPTFHLFFSYFSPAFLKLFSYFSPTFLPLFSYFFLLFSYFLFVIVIYACDYNNLMKE